MIAASNRDLLEEVEADRFREDLYYRFECRAAHLPPLRERREDIPELIAHFLNHYNEENDRYVVHIERQGDGRAARLSLAGQRPASCRTISSARSSWPPAMS